MIDKDSNSHKTLMEDAKNLVNLFEYDVQTRFTMLSIYAFLQLNQYMNTVGYDMATTLEPDYFAPVDLTTVEDEFILHFNVHSREVNSSILKELLEMDAKSLPDATLRFGILSFYW